MKNWKLVILVVGILLLVAAFAAYEAQMTSCYPPAATVAQFSPEYLKAFRDNCKLDSAVFIQFNVFLMLVVPGLTLFSAYWVLTRPQVKNRPVTQLNIFLLLIIFDSLLVTLVYMLAYPAQGTINPSTAWVLEVIAALGFLCYLAALALWHWKRWGLALFQGTSVTLAIFILLGGGSLILAAVILAGVIGLSLLMRSWRDKLV